MVAGLCAGALGSDTGGSIRGTGLPLRHRRTEADLRADQPGGRVAALLDARPRRADDPHRRRHGVAVAGAGRVRSGRPASARVEIPDYRLVRRRASRACGSARRSRYVESAPDLDPETLAAYRQALAAFEQLGARVEPVELPDVEHATVVGWVLTVAEAFAFHEPEIQARPEISSVATFYSRVLQGALVSGADYVQAQRGRNVVCASIAGRDGASRSAGAAVQPPAGLELRGTRRAGRTGGGLVLASGNERVVVRLDYSSPRARVEW